MPGLFFVVQHPGKEHRHGKVIYLVNDQIIDNASDAVKAVVSAASHLSLDHRAVCLVTQETLEHWHRAAEFFELQQVLCKAEASLDAKFWREYCLERRHLFQVTN